MRARTRIGDDQVVELAEMFRLMSDPTRLRIILACLDAPAPASTRRPQSEKWRNGSVSRRRWCPTICVCSERRVFLAPSGAGDLVARIIPFISNSLRCTRDRSFAQIRLIPVIAPRLQMNRISGRPLSF